MLNEQVELTLQQFINQLSSDLTRLIRIERTFTGQGYAVTVAATNAPQPWLTRLWSLIAGKR